MITKRLLRLALGPSFLESPEEGDISLENAKKNSEQRVRLCEAEAKVLDYVGLVGGGPGNQGDQEKQDDGQEDVQLNYQDREGNKPKEEEQRRKFHLAAHALYMFIQWPTYKIMAKTATFGGPVSRHLGMFKNDILVNGIGGAATRIYGGLVYTMIYESFVHVGNQVFKYPMTKYIVGASRSKDKKKIESNKEIFVSALWELWGGLKILAPAAIGYFMLYPILEMSVIQTLDLDKIVPWTPRSLEDMFNFKYMMGLLAQETICGWMFGWKIAESLVHDVLYIAIKDEIDFYTRGSKHTVKARSAIRFFTDLMSSTLAEFICLPISRKVFTLIACKYGCPSSVLQLDIKSVFTAMLLEWAGTFLFVQANSFFT